MPRRSPSPRTRARLAVTPMTLVSKRRSPSRRSSTKRKVAFSPLVMPSGISKIPEYGDFGPSGIAVRTPNRSGIKVGLRSASPAGRSNIRRF